MNAQVSAPVASLQQLDKTIEMVCGVAYSAFDINEMQTTSDFLYDLLGAVNEQAIQGYENEDLEETTSLIRSIYGLVTSVCSYELVASQAMELLHATCDKQLWEANDDVLDIYSALVKEM